LQNAPFWGELFTVNPDGTNARQLTHPPNGTEDTHPDWSPDGSRVVFTRQPPRGAYSIWIVNADGTHLRRVIPPCPPGGRIPRCPADDSWPVWSPDGRQLAFQRFSGPLRPKSPAINDDTAIYKDEIVITDANGGHVRTLVWLGPYRGDPQAPAWSPDGERLVLVGKFMTSKTNASGCECRRLYVINADGTGMHPITPLGLRPGGRPDWSPDGTKILFRTHPTDDSSGANSDLYTVLPDGTRLHRVTHYADAGERVIEGSYSPDGRFIVFETSHGAVGSSSPDVFIMTAGGTSQTQVTQTRNFEDDADWGRKP
jgi:Tol biopolymer transport system component